MKSPIVLDTVPSPKDDRDYRYSQRHIDLKETIDLREWDSPVEDQLSIGSCVGNAIASAYELTVRRLYPEKFTELSRLFIYYNSRLFDNSYTEDTGTYIRDGLKASARYGICEEKLWPYVEDKFNVQPTPECYVNAAHRIVTRYESLYSLKDMIEILNDNRPIVVGMKIYDNFMSLSPVDSIIKLPRVAERRRDSHAVVVIGYNMSSEIFLAKNSFGTTWGEQGYFWIPFEYMRTQAFEKWCFDISSQNTILPDQTTN